MLTAITVVLDGMPWLPIVYQNLCATTIDWHWYVVEGVAAPVNCSAHCRAIPERLSNDGTTEFLELASKNPQVTYLRQTLWQGKIEMLNLAVEAIKEPCLLMQIDSDELWRPDYLEKIHMLHDDWPVGGSAKFHCRYFLGPNIVSSSPNSYGNYDYEWIRAWSFQPGMKFDTHCPPVLDGNRAEQMSRDATRRMGIIFDHMAWATRKQVEFKSQFYGYKDAVEGWDRMQLNTNWPVKLRDYLSWTDDNATADKLW